MSDGPWIDEGTYIYYNAGNVGIGTASPSYRTSIVGDGGALSGTGRVNTEVLQDQTNWKGVRFGYDTASTTGIVASSSLGVLSNLAFWNFDGSVWAEHMRIAGSGNVGIGTASPTHKLDVAGDVNFTGGLCANGQAILPARPPCPIPLGGSVTPDWSVTSSYYGPHGTWLALGRLWVGYAYQTPGVIEVLDPYTGQAVHAPITFSSDSYHGGVVDLQYCPALGKMLALHASGGHIVLSVIDPETYAVYDAINDTGHAIGSWGAFCTTDSHTYVLSNQEPSVLYEYAFPSGWPPATVTSPSRTLTLSNYGGAGKDLWDGHCCRFDGRYIFVTASDGGPVAGGRWSVMKIDPLAADWSSGGIVAAGVVVSDLDAVFTDDMALLQGWDDYDRMLLNYQQQPAGNYGFVGCGSEKSGKLVVFNKSDLSVYRVVDPQATMTRQILGQSRTNPVRFTVAANAIPANGEPVTITGYNPQTDWNSCNGLHTAISSPGDPTHFGIDVDSSTFGDLGASQPYFEAQMSCWCVTHDGRYFLMGHGGYSPSLGSGRLTRVSLTGKMWVTALPFENPNEIHTDGTSYFFTFFYGDSSTAPGKVCAVTP